MQTKNSRLTNSFRFRPQAHPLEDRTNPSGNVTALVFDGVLYVGGDDAANAFAVTGTGATDATVAPLDADTTVNGQSGVAAFSGIRKGFHVVAGAGDDTIQLMGLQARDTINVIAGDGNDVLRIGGSFAGEGSIVDLGEGNNRIDVAGSSFGKLFSLRSGSGDDVLSVTGNSFREVALFNGGGGTNTSTFGGNSFARGMVSLFSPAPVIPPQPASIPTDTEAPSVVLSTSASAITNRTPIPVTATFSKAVSNLTLSGVSVTNGAASNLTQIDDRTFTFDVAPTADGPVSIAIPADVTADGEGRTNTASASLDLTFDSTAPAVTANDLTTTASAPTLTGTVGDPTATVQVTVDSVDYTARVTDGTWTVDLPTLPTEGARTVAVKAIDPAGNASTASATLIVDRSSFGTTLTTTAGATTDAAILPYTARFDRDASDFTASDIVATNGTVSGFVAVSPRVYTFSVTPLLDGVVSVSIAAGAARDAAGNASIAATSSVTRDTVAPVPTIATTEVSPTSLSPIPFTATFSEPVTGFSIGDISTTDGTVSRFVAVSATTYTFDVTPTADGSVIVSVLSGVARDLAGNANSTGTASANSLRTDAGMANALPDTSSSAFVALGTLGLKIRDVQTGTGTAATASSTVMVFYTGWLASDGTVFDSARTEGAPAEFALAGLIDGFREAAIGMRPGGIRQVFIPSALGYGAAGSPPEIPANADLVFEIKLLGTT